MGRPGTAASLSTDQLRQEWLTLRGELGVARSQLASTRQDKVPSFLLRVLARASSWRQSLLYFGPVNIRVPLPGVRLVCVVQRHRQRN